MRVLLTGATGFIGSAVLARLRDTGHEVVAVTRARDAAALRLGAASLVHLDMSKAASPEHWTPHLAGIEAVVNCAGVLQDSARDSTAGVHIEGAAALFAACERSGVRRVIQVSAIGIDRETPTAFSRTKLAGDEALMARDLDWVILRPSVVVGRSAYGGSALFRGLAALPILPVLPDTGPLQLVQLADVAETVAFFLQPDAPTRLVIELAGPQRLTYSEVVAQYRRWLGWQPARQVPLPGWMARLGFRLGDLAGRLGWRAPIRSTARLEIGRGAVGDPTRWTELTGVQPQSLRKALAAEPSSVQERWFARLYLLKPVLFATLSLFWIVTGLISLGPGFPGGRLLMAEAGAGHLAGAAVAAGALLDILLGVWRRVPADIAARAPRDSRRLHPLRGSRHDPGAASVGRPARAAREDRAHHGLEPRRPGDSPGPLMLYLALKYLHIIGAAVLLGAGAGIAFFMLAAHLTRDAGTIAGVARIVVIADFIFTATAVIAQPVTGALLVRAVGYSFAEPWIALSILLYLVTGAFWLPVVFMQMRMRDLAAAAARSGAPLPAAYHRMFRIWFIFGFPAFAAVLAIFWLMIARPDFSLPPYWSAAS